MKYIYTLTDPFELDIKYVGCTSNYKMRMSSHLSNSKKLNKTELHKWINKLREENSKPIFSIIEIVDDDLCEQKEKYWIKYFRDKNCNLYNLTNGGFGTNGLVYTDELREKRKLARLGVPHTDEAKDKIRKRHSRKIICIEDNKVLPSLVEAAKYSGVPQTTFHRYLHFGKKICGKTYKYIDIEYLNTIK